MAFTDDERDAFIAGYCEAMLWANTRDSDDPDNVDIEPAWWQSPSRHWQLEAFSVESQRRIEEVCDDFMRATEPMLRAASMIRPERDMSYHGHDLALTQNHHGAGFWDRGYPRALGDALTEAAEAMGAADAWFTNDEPVVYEG